MTRYIVEFFIVEAVFFLCAILEAGKHLVEQMDEQDSRKEAEGLKGKKKRKIRERKPPSA